jgi:hypothetical protein
MSSVTPDEILSHGSKARPLYIQPWVAAQLSDVWQSMKKNIQITLVQKQKGKQDLSRIYPIEPASSHNQT